MDGRTDGRTDEGNPRGPRGPKQVELFILKHIFVASAEIYDEELEWPMKDDKNEKIAAMWARRHIYIVGEHMSAGISSDSAGSHLRENENEWQQCGEKWVLARIREESDSWDKNERITTRNLH